MARRGFGSINPQTGGKDKLKMGDLVEIFDLPKEAKNTWVNLRFLPTDMLPVKTHWIKILAGKEKKEVKIPKLCVSFDPDAEGTPKEGTHCPYCELTQGGDDATCQTSVAYYANAIVREIQEDMPRKVKKPTDKERKSGIIEIGSKTWTPVRVVRMPNGLAGKLDGLTERNFAKIKGEKVCVPIDDPKYGIDIAIKFDPKAAGSEKYQIDKGERTPLDDEEKEYLVWDLSDDLYDKLGLESTDEAKKEFKRLEFVGGEEIIDDDDDEDDDDDIGFASKKKGKKGKKPSRYDDDEDDDDDDEDDAPWGDDDDDDDDDDDEPPRKKKKKSSKKAKSGKKKKRPVDDDDDEDDDDEPPRKKKKKPLKKKKRPVDDDDEDDEPPRKKKKKPSSGTKKPLKKKKKRI